MDHDDLISCPGVLALECAPGTHPSRVLLERDEIEVLAGFIAADLAGLLPDLTETRLAVAGALFDAAQLLRPQFPAYATLDELAARLPRDRGGIVAFGARDGRMPAQPLTPDPVLAGSPMLYLPWTLQAPQSIGKELGEAMEVELIGRGEAGTRTADFLMRTLDMQLEHARYLSRHDLMALTCVQYEHANLAPLWNVLEAALLSPASREDTVSARGLPMRYADGTVQIASPLTQLRERASDADDDVHTLAGWVFELRQFAAVLQAHAVPMQLDGNADDASTRFLDIHAPADPALPPPALYTHRAPGLGVIAVSVAQTDGARMHVLANALLLGGRLDDHLAVLAARFDADAAPHELERVHLDADRRLTPPPAQRLH
ncbi:hypothetical protein [Oleiagrimonas sp. MCCC 1A03011]|uniref:hypothetical protein n=1 Tax=Oleiagrimonas sp. MCCC 1A03011 TaxID=1926883 RepID=UPI000DC5CE86|nr:hypothetical protein [Oleiagrimonas sp. MCCC 1A03011]RAP57239.1 hypothetical protein BTJ49_10850 [Oleiagrimonas sp. MCCC 1A03011]